MKLALALLCLATLAAAQVPKMTPLPVVLPHPLFEGTPEPPNVPNLEKPLGRPRPAFLAPSETVNVAKGKPVSSSDSEPVVGNLEMITDGVKTGMDGSVVELKAGVQSVVIDLEEKQTIYAILIWHYHKEARAYDDVIVQTAGDPDFIENVQTLFNNDTDNAAGFGIGKDRRYVETSEGKLIDARGVEARYVRLISNGSDKTKANHYVEVEVYGKPAQ
jgi:hypothetical protein